MNSLAAPLPARRVRTSPLAWLREAHAREPRLTVFALVMWAAMVPALFALGLDDRMLRGVPVWAKPLKFIAAIGLFAISTAWFVGLLPAARRRGRTVAAVAWTIIAAGTFEIGYIVLQAALGEGSHYNFSDPLHVALYRAMGAGALAMTATQAVLAWQIARHGDATDRPWRDAVVCGLALTFLLGAGAGGLLGGFQPPAGSGLPLFGWHLGGGDLRPAHFLGLHAQQFVPLAGLLLAAAMPRRPRAALGVFVAAYAALWAAALALGLAGAVLTTPAAQGTP